MHADERLHARNTETTCPTRTCKSDCEIRVNYTKSVNDNSLNLLTETIGFKIIRKIFDEHQPVTALEVHLKF